MSARGADEERDGGAAHQPRPAAVRRRRSDQARPRRLPRRGAGAASFPSSRTGRCRSSGSTGGKRRSCRRTSRSTRRRGCAPSAFWAESSKREVSYALCNDRRTLLWFANQRAVEYHPTLARADRPDRTTHLVLDLDPPEGASFAMAVRAAHLVRQALTDVGLEGAVKTSGAKGVHVFVPIDDQAPPEDAAAATRAIAARAERLDPAIATTAFMKEDRDGKVFVDATRVGGATVVAAYSPRVRPGVTGLVPGELGGARRSRAGRLHRAHRARAPRRRQPLARTDAGAAAPPRRARRRRPRHPRRPGAGHARGPAPGPQQGVSGRRAARRSGRGKVRSIGWLGASSRSSYWRPYCPAVPVRRATKRCSPNARRRPRRVPPRRPRRPRRPQPQRPQPPRRPRRLPLGR